MKLNRILCAMLAALTVLPAASCASDPIVQETETTPAVTDPVVTAEPETTPDPNARENAKDSLPEDLNLDGREVMIYSFQQEEYDIIGKNEESGDVLFDAVFHRTVSVAERLNVKLNWTDSPAAKWTEHSAELNSTIMAGDDAWQIVYAMGNATIQSNRSNLFMDLSDAKYLDYSQPWWWNEAMDEVSFDGKERKYLVGDLALSNYLRAGCYYFNKAIYTDVFGDPDEMYKIVLDGAWDYDKLKELSAAAYRDVNGNGSVDEGDIYGVIVGNPELLKHSEHALDIKRYYRGEDGYPVFEYDVERAQLAEEKIYNLLFNTTGNKYQAEYLSNTIFTQSNLLYFPSQILQAFSATFREMEDDYGIIPYPKLDDKQQNYANLIQNSSNYVTIPITCQNSDEVGAVIEAMCAESYRSVVEVFYDIALKTKYTRDSYSGQCIDLIRDVSKKKFAYEYDGQFKCGNLITNSVRNGGGNFASTYASTITTANNLVEKKIAEMEKEKAK